MKNLLISFTLFISFSSFGAEETKVNCIYTDVAPSSLETQTLGQRTGLYTMIQDISKCSDSDLFKMKKELGLDIRERVPQLEKLFQKNNMINQMYGGIPIEDKINEMEAATRLARRTGALALVKSEINERMIRKKALNH